MRNITYLIRSHYYSYYYDNDSYIINFYAVNLKLMWFVTIFLIFVKFRFVKPRFFYLYLFFQKITINSNNLNENNSIVSYYMWIFDTNHDDLFHFSVLKYKQEDEKNANVQFSKGPMSKNFLHVINIISILNLNDASHTASIKDHCDQSTAKRT